MSFFNTSYIRIYCESKLDSSIVAKKRIMALQELLPINILDVPYAYDNLILPRVSVPQMKMRKQ